MQTRADALRFVNDPSDTLTVVRRFNDAFNQHDVDAIMAQMTPDCCFENTRPSPNGTRYQGAAAVRAYWEQFFANSPKARFEASRVSGYPNTRVAS